jgi:flagellar basal-body rod protein FlgG
VIRSLWIAKTGLEAQQLQMDTISNNLANVSTNGFKRSNTVFEDLIYQNLRQPSEASSSQNSSSSGLQVGTGVRPVATERIHTQGNLQQTGNKYDLAISGEGFLPVVLPNGSAAYTRDGSLHTNSQGQIVTTNGYSLQAPITIPADAESVNVASDGTVTVVQPGSIAPVQIGNIQLATFANPSALESKGGNLYAETASSGTAKLNQPGSSGTGSLTQGYLETSNVNVVEELVKMIQTQRAFEINSKAIAASDQMLQKLSQL